MSRLRPRASNHFKLALKPVDDAVRRDLVFVVQDWSYVCFALLHMAGVMRSALRQTQGLLADCQRAHLARAAAELYKAADLASDVHYPLRLLIGGFETADEEAATTPSPWVGHELLK